MLSPEEALGLRVAQAMATRWHKVLLRERGLISEEEYQRYRTELLRGL